jgi:hypothetical protein
MLSPGFLAYFMLQNLHILLLQPLNLLLFQLDLRDNKSVPPKPTLRLDYPEPLLFSQHYCLVFIRLQFAKKGLIRKT